MLCQIELLAYDISKNTPYFTSRCKVCFRSERQYFLISSRFGETFLLRVVV